MPAVPAELQGANLIDLIMPLKTMHRLQLHCPTAAAPLLLKQMELAQAGHNMSSLVSLQLP